ncbi:NAD(P)-dependent oxidoreductase [bacterium]|nr:NAD(P)-dependent oxidoreductase [bacterium]
MRIFVAGATGVIGRYTVPLLLQAGHEVTGITRSEERAAELDRMGAGGRVVDIYDREKLIESVREARPEAVMNLLTDLVTGNFSGNSRIRIEGTRNLVDAAKAAGARRMIAESLAWIYAAGDAPATEDDPVAFGEDSPRGENLEAVRILEEQSGELPECVILRYGALYGPATFYAADGGVAQRAKAGKLEATDAVTSFVHLQDSGSATAAAIEWPAGAYNIVDDEPAAGTVWAPVYASSVGAPPPTRKAGRNPWERGASNAKARSQGWKLIYPSWREGFAAEFG